MTQTGKCSTCRSRKVKCDQEKPKCGACRKKNRPCNYTYGKATAFVQEDPKQFSKHGRPKTAPIVYPFISSYQDIEPNPQPLPCLRLTTESQAKSGSGVFQTFALVDKKDKLENQESRLMEEEQSCQVLSSPLRKEGYSMWAQPSGSALTLASRYVHLLSSHIGSLEGWNSMHGSWMDLIPSRLGSSPVLDVAVEYIVNGFMAYQNTSFTTQKSALVSRGRASKALRMALQKCNKVPSYDVLLASKLLSYAEIFVNVGSFGFADHLLGLSQLLKCGSATGMDSERYWSLVDNTYMDEALEALSSGRVSTYDTEMYRCLSSPLTVIRNIDSLKPLYLESRSIMHCFIQLPRFACLVRQSILNPRDTQALSLAIFLAQSLWTSDPYALMDKVLKMSITAVPTPPSSMISNFIPESFWFNDVSTIVLLCRYWTYQIYFSAIMQNLCFHYPAECIAAGLPEFETFLQVDVQAATYVAQSFPHVLSISPSLPLTPLRVLGSLSGSVGTWCRLTRYHLRAQDLKISAPDQRDLSESEELRKAKTMKKWIIEQCNMVLKAWTLARVEEKLIELLADSMAGGEIMECVTKRYDWEEVREWAKSRGLYAETSP